MPSNNPSLQGRHQYTVHWRVVDERVKIHGKLNMTRVRGDTIDEAMEKIRHKLDVLYPYSHIDISIVAKT